MTTLAKLRDKPLADPEVRAEYDRLGPVVAVVGTVIVAEPEAGVAEAKAARSR